MHRIVGTAVSVSWKKLAINLLCSLCGSARYRVDITALVLLSLTTHAESCCALLADIDAHKYITFLYLVIANYSVLYNSVISEAGLDYDSQFLFSFSLTIT